MWLKLQYKSLQRTRNLTNGHLKFQACFFQESIYEECAIGRMNEWNTSLGYMYIHWNGWWIIMNRKIRNVYVRVEFFNIPHSRSSQQWNEINSGGTFFCIHNSDICLPYARYHNSLLIINCSGILAIHRDRILRKKIHFSLRKWGKTAGENISHFAP